MPRFKILSDYIPITTLKVTFSWSLSEIPRINMTLIIYEPLTVSFLLKEHTCSAAPSIVTV